MLAPDALNRWVLDVVPVLCPSENLSQIAERIVGKGHLALPFKVVDQRLHIAFLDFAKRSA